jgi:dihydroxyacid dehydratase/phosphogluconate dehydratase
MAERKKNWQPVKRDLGGWLARYQELVTNASRGGVLG